MVETKRKKGETYEAMLKRFLNRVQKSGKSKEVKRRRFHSGQKSLTKRRSSATGNRRSRGSGRPSPHWRRAQPPSRRLRQSAGRTSS